MGDIEKEISSDFSNVKIKAMINIKYTASWINRHEIQWMQPFKISPQQYNILRILKGAKIPLTVQTIKSRMVEKTPNTTRLLDKLIEKNLVDRARCEKDRRVVHISITENGLSLLNEMNVLNNKNILKNLTENEAIQLSTLLDKIR